MPLVHTYFRQAPGKRSKRALFPHVTSHETNCTASNTEFPDPRREPSYPQTEIFPAGSSRCTLSMQVSEVTVYKSSCFSSCAVHNVARTFDHSSLVFTAFKQNPANSGVAAMTGSMYLIYPLTGEIAQIAIVRNIGTQAVKSCHLFFLIINVVRKSKIHV